MTWEAPNTSKGFKDSLKACWERLKPDARMVLLAGEGAACAAHFRKSYPSWGVVSVNFDRALGPDIVADMCRPGWIIPDSYDLIINQANLEHVYDPFGCCKQLTIGLAPGGVHVLHTHTQEAPYHAYPRDYVRFMPDWFEDLPQHLGGALELVELWREPEDHIFAAYRKLA